MIRFSAYGLPSQKGSAKGFGFIRKTGPRAGKIGVNITNDAGKRAKTWAATVHAAAMEAMRNADRLTGPVAVEVTFVLPRPKAHYHKGALRRNAPRYVEKRPDSDKLARCALDALTFLVFKDDAQIADLRAIKVYGEQVGAHFVAWRLADSEAV